MATSQETEDRETCAEWNVKLSYANVFNVYLQPL